LRRPIRLLDDEHRVLRANIQKRVSRRRAQLHCEDDSGSIWQTVASARTTTAGMLLVTTASWTNPDEVAVGIKGQVCAAAVVAEDRVNVVRTALERG